MAGRNPGTNPAEAGVESLVLLGCGKMGGALLEGWLKGGLAPERVQVIEPQPPDWLGRTGVTINPETPGPASVAVLAVKPQMMAEAAPALEPLAGQGTLFVSIAAGTPIGFFEGLFGEKHRARPPAAVGRGITALIGNARVGEERMRMAEALLAAVGETVRLEDEGEMHAVTGLSGSGPAYVFHLIEAMAEAGAAAGLRPELAMRLARATVAGAGALAEASDEPAERLRANVTSPGGTTAAGLGVLMDELPDLMGRTVAAAARRSRELAGDD